MWILFDDARMPAEGEALLFDAPHETIVARSVTDVPASLDRLRGALAKGHHVAGYLAYEAGYALDPATADLERCGEGPLVCFGVFDAPTRVGRGSFLDAAGPAVWSAARPAIDRADYLAAAATVREALFAGDYYQANLTFPARLHVGGDPLALYARLAARGGGGWGGVMVHADGALVSLSPEQFFKIEGGLLSTRPMKGTARRRRDDSADRREIERLRSDEKQRAENLMIVDLLRNDMARVSETGSVEVPELFAVETYPTVHQMVSRITSRLREGLDAVDVLEALFPCGSVTGAPKIAAMRALHDLEPHPRGAYTGSMGWIAPPGKDGAGDAAFNVLIRTIEIVAGRPQAVLGLGSGLVVDSVPSDEWDECLLKGVFVNGAANEFDLIETMGYDPMEGVVELERHLLRLKETAADLGFAFDRHDARNELQAATFGHREEAMMRLLASKTGAIAIEIRPKDAPPTEPVSVQVKPLPVDPGDMRLRYKTSARSFYDAAREPDVAFETLFVDPDGFLTEGSFTNLFVEQDGMLVTPPLSRGLLPGVLRQKLIDEGKAIEGDVRVEDLRNASKFCIGNSARGLMKARLVAGSGSEREA
ncbi:aminodeoxychorismate synthase component I [Sphingomicrobium sp. XHP0235]|uniref:aminodeoxychorismate synthase component I n=1 Tax=Sphingomicrobium aquimarinum TaxID=3133971 RepID=UPI0031FE6087